MSECHCLSLAALSSGEQALSSPLTLMWMMLCGQGVEKDLVSIPIVMPGEPELVLLAFLEQPRHAGCTRPVTPGCSS